MALRSWVQVDTFSHFPIQNLPYGIFSTVQHPKPRAGVAIGEFVLDLAAASRLAPLSRTKAAQASAFHQVCHERKCRKPFAAMLMLVHKTDICDMRLAS